ncbi:MAG: RnfABCDGE type electron transport complex subunit D [Oscillospiraceae bacterium]|nr:RnfABCDGE type electron transport complex subunit D [Oscillospiraceae bacterium]
MQNTDIKLTISSSPHLRTSEGTSSIMLDVIIALIPALAVSMYIFGIQALIVTAVSVIFSVFFEWAYRKLLHKSKTIGDFSAIVTGILLAYCLPVSTPLWIIVVGDFFAIVIVKQLFGGIGQNFVNPALAARAFLFSYPVVMSTWVKPLSYTSFLDTNMTDAVTGATPLASLSNSVLPEGINLMQAFFGQIGGSMGEISAFALILGGIYLIIRRVITPRIPLAYLLTVAVLTFIFPRGNNNLIWMAWNLFSGGVMLGAIFMATDYATSPITPVGQIIYGIGCGLLTVFIRYFGSYPEGTSYAILLMNICVWLIDKATMPRRFGYTREMKQAEKAKLKSEKAAAKEANA